MHEVFVNALLKQCLKRGIEVVGVEYDHWLEELKKGNVTDEWFDKNVWEPYQSFELHLMAGEDITRLESIADQLEFVNRKLIGQMEKIDELLNATKGE